MKVSSQQAIINDRYLPSIRSSRLCITLFNTVNLMPLQLQYVRNGGGVRRGLMKAVTNRYENFLGREWSGLIRYIKEKRQEFFHYLTENSNSQAKQAVLINSSKIPRKYFILIAISCSCNYIARADVSRPTFRFKVQIIFTNTKIVTYQKGRGQVNVDLSL